MIICETPKAKAANLKELNEIVVVFLSETVQGARAYDSCILLVCVLVLYRSTSSHIVECLRHKLVCHGETENERQVGGWLTLQVCMCNGRVVIQRKTQHHKTQHH